MEEYTQYVGTEHGKIRKNKEKYTQKFVLDAGDPAHIIFKLYS
jgi:hypothetical protein